MVQNGIIDWARLGGDHTLFKDMFMRLDEATTHPDLSNLLSGGLPDTSQSTVSHSLHVF